MEFGVCFDSVGQFEFDAGGFVDGCCDFEVVVGGRGEEGETDFVDPFAAVVGADLKVGEGGFGFVREDVQSEGDFL